MVDANNDRGFARLLLHEVEILEAWAMHKPTEGSDVRGGDSNRTALNGRIGDIVASASELTPAERATDAFDRANAKYKSMRHEFGDYWWMKKYPLSL